MCRLYAYRSNEPEKVECTLVHSQNALMLQSRSDMTGREHSDGWGIGYYTDSTPTIEKQAGAAFRDLSFSRAAESVYSKTVIAHVRLATVGTPQIENAHPFQFGNWMFAHNGTVQGFPVLKDQLEAETDPVLQATRKGKTDSEQLFLWLLSRLLKTPSLTEHGDSNPEKTAGYLAELIAEMSQRSQQAAEVMEIDRPPKLNIVLTDGETLFATRFNNSLFYTTRHRITDCEICGVPHVHHQPGAHFESVVLASEPISDEIWHEVPNHTLLYVTKDIRVTQMSIDEIAPQQIQTLGAIT